MTAAFDQAVTSVFLEEGGYADDPNDPGGPTVYGIARRYHPHEPWPPTKDRAREIYRTEYWTLIRGDSLPLPLAIAMLDCAVNQGVATAAKMLQRIVRTVPDGWIGPQTLRAVGGWNVGTLVDELMTFRALRYAADDQFERYGDNWLRRLFAVHARCVASSSTTP